MRHDLLLPLLLLAAVSAPVAAQDQITLRYDPRPDLPVRLHTTTAMQIAITDLAAQVMDSTGQMRTMDGDELGALAELGQFVLEVSHTVTRQAVERQAGGWIVEAHLESMAPRGRGWMRRRISRWANLAT